MIDLTFPVLLVFSLPGFMFLKVYGYKYSNVFDCYMMSLFCGMILFGLMDLFGFKFETSNIYAITLSASLMAVLSAWALSFWEYLSRVTEFLMPKDKKLSKSGSAKKD